MKDESVQSLSKRKIQPHTFGITLTEKRVGKKETEKEIERQNRRRGRKLENDLIPLKTFSLVKNKGIKNAQKRGVCTFCLLFFKSVEQRGGIFNEKFSDFYGYYRKTIILVEEGAREWGDTV